MAIVLGLLAALSYGASDFAAGIASRRVSAGPVTAVAQAVGLATAGVGVLLFPGIGPRTAALELGALSGVGSAIGTLALYHGMTTGRMAIVATLSAVLTAVIPVLAGLLAGERLSALALIGIVLAVPAIGLIAWQPGSPANGHARPSGAGYGLLSGVGFAVLFIALDRAGTRSGAWPLLPGQAMSLLLVLPFARISERSRRGADRNTIILVLATGVVSGGANLLFLAATGHGDLAIVSVLSAMYPAVTVIMARLLLSEKTTARQSLGLIVAAAAIILVTIG